MEMRRKENNNMRERQRVRIMNKRFGELAEILTRFLDPTRLPKVNIPVIFIYYFYIKMRRRKQHCCFYHLILNHFIIYYTIIH